MNIKSLSKIVITLLTLFNCSHAVWNVETVDDSTGDVGWYSSLAIDASGYAHISYYDYTNYDLKYATNKTGTWVKTTLDAAGGTQTSIALDNSNNPHISYIAASNLKYIKFNGSTWDTPVSIGTADGTYRTSLVINQTNNNVHISYIKSGYLQHEKYDGAWTSTQVTNTGAPLDSSISLNGSNPYIGYIANNDDSFHTAKYNGATWDIDGTPPAITLANAYYHSMKLNTSNFPCVSYNRWGASNNDLRYAVWGGVSWSYQTVDTGTQIITTGSPPNSQGTMGWWNSLALDTSNYAHISYHVNGSIWDLKYAKYIPGTFTISGYVTTGVTPITGAVVFLTGAANCNYVTDNTGYYEFTDMPSGDYLISPALAGWTFNPSSRSYNSLSSSYSNQNFTGGGGSGYFIRGYVTEPNGTPVSDCLVSLGGTAPGSYTTTANGYYEFTGLVTGNYTVTPTKMGWVFIPDNYSYTSLDSNQESQNFYGVPSSVISYIRGYVKDSSGKPINGVTVTMSGTKNSTYVTADNGYYEFVELPFGNYTITATKPEWSFAPAVKTINYLYSNRDNENFIGVKGTINLSDDVKILGNLFNPNNGEVTTVWYNVITSGNVVLKVFTIDGILVKELMNGYKDAGPILKYGQGKMLMME